MLQSIRSKAQGIVTWIIVSLIILAFSFVGIKYFFSPSGPDSVAACVNGEKIYRRTIENVYQDVYRQHSMRPDFDPSSINPKRVKKQIRDSLVKQVALLLSAEKSGYRVGNEQLKQMMKGIPQFQKDGKFSKEVYYAVLQQAGLNEASYQNNLKKEILLTQLRRGVDISTFATEKEKNQIIELINQKRDFGYVILSHEDFAKGAKVTEEQVKNYYNSHKKNYMSKEEVELSYIELSLENLQSKIEYNEDDLKKYYEKNASNFVTPEKVKVSHIFIHAPSGSDKEKSGEARLKANDILAKIQVDGENFEDLVAKYSEDKFSVKNRGSIGWIGRGEIAKGFEELAFSLKLDEVAQDIVQTEFGYHIVKVTNKIEEENRSYDEVKDEIITAYKKEQADIILSDKSEDLANLAFEYPDSLEDAAKSLNLEIKESKKFSRKGLKTGIESVKKVIDAAFSEEVLDNKNSDLIKINDESYVVVRVKNHYPKKQLQFTDVKDDIKDSLIKQHGKKQAILEGNKLVAKIKEGKNPSEAAVAQNLKWNIVTKAPRGYNKLHYVIMKSVFNLPRHCGNNCSKRVKGIILPNGDYVIVALSKVLSGKLEKTKEYSVEQLDKSYKNHVGLSFGRYEYNLYQDSILKDAKVSYKDVD